VAAYSSKFKANERVDTMHIGGIGEHYGLNVPAGNYDLLVFVDSNTDGVFSASEDVAQRKVSVTLSSAPDKVLGQVELQLSVESPDSRSRRTFFVVKTSLLAPFLYRGTANRGYWVCWILEVDWQESPSSGCSSK